MVRYEIFETGKYVKTRPLMIHEVLVKFPTVNFEVLRNLAIYEFFMIQDKTIRRVA